LSRFSNRIRGVRLKLEFPDTAATTRCEVSVKLDSGEQLRVEDESRDVRLMVDHAVERLGRLVGRHLASRDTH
jgi:ribosome-associated translation inhibitor RaiA